jgi:hypothetical protein
MDALASFREVWLCDFEFRQSDGERPTPLCMVAREWRTGQTIRLWQDQLLALPGPPFGIGPASACVAYYASAELSCFLARSWQMPAYILDLYAEFRCLASGLPVPCGSGLLGALTYFGLDGIAAAEKDHMRQLAMRGGPYTAGERQALMDYCQTDVDALAKLLPAMLPGIDIERALLRGRYMAAAARMEWTGIPIDMPTLARLRANWSGIRGRLIARVDKDHGVFVPAGRRTLDPDSRFGAAILETAREWSVDPYTFADAVDAVWAEERQATEDVFAARRAARKATGLTARRIGQWENAGRDSAAYPGLDETARQMAAALPALGIGDGYRSDTGEDNNDYAGRLWELLRERDERIRPRHHPDILRRAAELVASCPASEPDYWRPMTFSAQRWAEYLARHKIPWPRLPSGALAMDDDTFREMARAYPVEVGPIRELRYALSQMRLNSLAVGSDGRNRCLLSAFGSRTGRNQPSNARYVFGPAVWLRGLIRPAEGMALAYVDWEQQEFGIAAALSQDPAMMAAYHSGDPYLAFAQQVGAIPRNGTKATHKAERERFKVLALGVQYGMQAEALARKLDESPARGRELIDLHRRTYPDYWRWSDAAEMTAMLSGQLQAVYGWTVRVGPNANPRSLRNFPLQANGAEMLRLSCILATERGIPVCGPVHDALLVEGPAGEIETVIAQTQEAMREASELVLPDFPLRTEAKIVRWPDRYSDPRGERFWRLVWELIGELETPPANGRGRAGTPPADGRGTPTVHDTKPLLPAIPPSSLLFSSLVPSKDVLPL